MTAPTPAPSTERWHGTNGGYHNHGCRCDDCRKAHAAYQRDYKARKAKSARNLLAELKEIRLVVAENTKTLEILRRRHDRRRAS